MSRRCEFRTPLRSRSSCWSTPPPEARREVVPPGRRVALLNDEAGTAGVPGENDPGVPGERHELAREGDSVSVGQLDVDQDRRRLQAGGSPHRPRDAVGLADDSHAAGGEQSPRQFAELRVVVHDENGSNHATNHRRRAATPG